MTLSLQSTYKLASGYEIPVVGFGVSNILIQSFYTRLTLIVLGLPNVCSLQSPGRYKLTPS